MASGISQLTAKLGSSAVKFAMTKGINATVASATLIASAANVISVTDASRLVNDHAKATNNEANVAAQILKIDRSELVNKNYLKLATRIDDYLTGKTDKLELDPSMYNSKPTTETPIKVNETSEALAKINANITQQIEEMPIGGPVANQEPTIMDVSSIVKNAAKEIEQKGNVIKPKAEPSQPRAPSIEKPSTIAPTAPSQVKPTTPEITQPKVEKPTDDAARRLKEIVDREKPIEKPKPIEEPKPAESIEEVKPAETVPAEVKPIEEVKPAETVPAETKPAETKPIETIEEVKPAETVPAETKPKEETKPIESIEEVKPAETVPAETKPKPAESIEEVKPAETAPSEEKPRVEEPKAPEIKADEEIKGQLTINLTRKFGNNKTADVIKVIKETKGIRHADGSEVWEPVVLTAKDLTDEQKVVHSSAGVHQLMKPDFVASYTPKSQNDQVDDVLTFAKGQKLETESPSENNNGNIESSTRVIRLIKEDGSELTRIVQDRSNETVTIPKVHGDYFTEQENLEYHFSSEDVNVTYRPIMTESTENIDYQVKSIDENQNLISSSTQTISAKVQLNNMTGEKTYESNSAIESKFEKAKDITGYTTGQTEFDHVNKVITHHYTKVVTKPLITDTDTLNVAPTPETVHKVATSMLERMPTLSNREEYSKYTSFDEAYSTMLKRRSIESLVFNISEGRYDYATSDRTLTPSQESVLAAEINSRFTDRLLERVNEFRRSVGLKELTKIATTSDMDRQFASATIFNYLANDHSNSKVGRAFEKATGMERIETMQPVHTLSTSKQGLTPEAAADSLFRTILKEANSYLAKDDGETGHLEQLIDPAQKSIYAGMFIGGYETKDIFIGMFGKQIKSGTKSSYKISTTLHYFK